MIKLIPDIPDRMDPDFGQEKHGQKTEQVAEKECPQQKQAYKDQCINLALLNYYVADDIIQIINDRLCIQMNLRPGGHQFFHPEKQVEKGDQHNKSHQREYDDHDIGDDIHQGIYPIRLDISQDAEKFFHSVDFITSDDIYPGVILRRYALQFRL